MTKAGGRRLNSGMGGFQTSARRRYGEAGYFVFCDHASNAMPAEHDGLHLPEDVLQTHIAWDIGAGALSEAIARRLGGALFACGFSRLLIDPNRAPEAADSIPAVSDRIPVPGNHDLSAAARAARRKTLFDPYHAALDAALDEATARPHAPFVVSVHSFTKRLIGETRDRPWPVGVLWRDDEESAHLLMARLKSRTGWPIGDNEPYNARLFNYSVDRHVASRGLAHATLEIRQDLIDTEEGVAAMAEMLTPVLAEIAALRAKERGAA